MNCDANTAINDLGLIIAILLFTMAVIGCGSDHSDSSPQQPPNLEIHPTLPPSVVQGLSCQLYDLSNLQPSELPDFDSQASQAVLNGRPSVTAQDLLTTFAMVGPIDFQSPQQVLAGAAGTWGTLPTTNFGLDCKGYMDVPVATGYMFKLTSDDGSQLLIDGASVVLNDGLHATTTGSGSVVMTAGTHAVELQYFQGPGQSVLELLSNLPVSFHQ